MDKLLKTSNVILVKENTDLKELEKFLSLKGSDVNEILVVKERYLDVKANKNICMYVSEIKEIK